MLADNKSPTTLPRATKFIVLDLICLEKSELLIEVKPGPLFSIQATGHVSRKKWPLWLKRSLYKTLKGSSTF
jgi:hypothetical protein